MRIVIDSNRVISSLIKDHTTRSILFNNKFQFYAPSFIKSEINKYKEDIMNKSRLNELEFNLLLDLIFEKIKIISYKEYNHLSEFFANRISDTKDLPYFVVCKFCEAVGIWTHDPHFKKQKEIRVLTNIDMLNLINK